MNYKLSITPEAEEDLEEIFYYSTGQNIIVIAIVYTGRNPRWISQRIKIT